MNITELLTQYQVPFDTEGKNVSEGWIGVRCPFCDDVSNHLGIHTNSGACHCWRCGSKALVIALAKLLDIPYNESARIVSSLDSMPSIAFKAYKQKPFILPGRGESLRRRHKDYLYRRGFDPDRLANEWGLCGTGPLAKMDDTDYKNRIVIPIYWNGEIVSFQTRAINDNIKPKYISCPKNREKRHHKDILYGNQNEWSDRVGICVEGVTDVWRLGTKAFATFGVNYTQEQVRQMARNFDTVCVLYDAELQAQRQAGMLVAELRFQGVKAFTYMLPVGKDPADLTQREADNLVRVILMEADL